MGLLQIATSEVMAGTTINIFTALLMSLGTGLVTGFSQWFFFRKKNNAEADGAQIENMGQIISTWRTALNDVNKDYEIKKNQLDQIEKEFNEFKVKADEMSLEISKLRVELHKKETQIKSLLRENLQLKSQGENID